jgi:hypothetical protein
MPRDGVHARGALREGVVNTSPLVRRPLALWGLIGALAFLAVGGWYGGVSMLLDPSGASLGMQEVVPRLPVTDLVLPGLFLIVVMGVGPLVAAYGLLARPRWPVLARLERASGRSWAWSAALTIGVVLAGWLALQGVLIGFRWPIQYVTAGNAAVIVALALSPTVRHHAGLDPRTARR